MLFAGLSADKVEFYKQAKTEITYSRDGDQWTINVGIVGIPNGSRVFKFVLGQPYDSVNIDGTPLKVHCLWNPSESMTTGEGRPVKGTRGESMTTGEGRPVKGTRPLERE